MKVIGYFEGTDSRLLTTWTLRDCGTLPLSNGSDGHGLYVGQVTNAQVSVVVGYLHKVVPPAWMKISAKDVLFNLGLQKIPLVVLVPEEEMATAREHLEGVAAEFAICDPGCAVDQVLEILGS